MSCSIYGMNGRIYFSSNWLNSLKWLAAGGKITDAALDAALGEAVSQRVIDGCFAFFLSATAVGGAASKAQLSHSVHSGPLLLTS